MIPESREARAAGDGTYVELIPIPETVAPFALGNGVTPARRERVRVDGRFFARGNSPLRINGVTYGPFASNSRNEAFPEPDRALADLRQMQAAGTNSVRTYYSPPGWLLELCDAEGFSVLVDVPWAKHVCFLEDETAQREARRAVRQAVEHGQRHSCVLGYSIGNEIPPDVVRWHGADRVERFLRELSDVGKQADPDCLLTYSNFPPTEYLDLSFLDFATFNVYLHDPDAFAAYLLRLQNIAGERPLLLGEVGMDTLRHGEEAQAGFLEGHLREALLLGVAGAFVFSWTDDWFTGGYRIEDWAFGITRADRTPKRSYYAVGDVFGMPISGLLPRTPRISVVVCSYNGGRTLEQCLRSLNDLDYPDYEVLLVDDGSTDNTREIAALFPEVRAIHQTNQGLSAARNVGLHAATGEIVAYTDSDCFADPSWLTHLVYQFDRTSAAAVGGPNLTPEDGTLAACIAAAPGQPIHVLETDELAEHIPGCNMAFRREALVGIGGFDPVYRKAGDDVDACWRLQESGGRIFFATGAFVWHHRRQTPKTYLRQQAGYGEAEALLRVNHPERFNSLGAGKWRGVYYGATLTGLRLSKRSIFRGRFGGGLFQCVYQATPAHWAMLPGTLEWHLAAGLAAMAVPAAAGWWVVPAGMLALSATVAGLQAAQACLPRHHDGFKSRLVVAALCYAQPLVRSWWRYRTRFQTLRRGREPVNGCESHGLPPTGTKTVEYWTERWTERTELLSGLVEWLREQGWMPVVSSGWSEWDLENPVTPWTIVRIQTAQEDHGSGRLLRVRYRLLPTEYLSMLTGVSALAGLLAIATQSWPITVCALAGAAAAAGLWIHCTRHAGRIAAGVEAVAVRMGFVKADRTLTRRKDAQ